MLERGGAEGGRWCARPAVYGQDAPVAALAGVSDGDAEKLSAAFGIKTVRDLRSNKYFAVAQALVALGAHSG
jgi:hypothetical protein